MQTSRLSPFPFRACDTVFRQQTRNESAHRTYIHCTGHQNPFIKRVAAESRLKGWDYHEIETGHMPITTAPEQLAALLDRIASAEAAGCRTFEDSR